MARVLLIQHDSIFESLGGIQYYLDDYLKLHVQLYGRENVRSLILQRGDSLRETPQDYDATFFKLPKNKLLQKLGNRFPYGLVPKAAWEIKQFRPTLLIASHVSLGPLTYLLSKISGIPFATFAYGTECWGGLWPQDEWALRRADKIISISHWTKTILAARGIEDKKIHILHPRLTDEFESIEAHKEKCFSPMRLLSISRLDSKEQYKGQDHTLMALAQLKDRAPELSFLYQVQGEGDDKPRLQSLTDKLGLTNDVQFIPFVKTRNELENIYRGADLFVMPSRFGKWDGAWRGEGFGIVYAEAAVLGVPSIAYRCGGVMDIIEEGRNGWLVEPDNIEALSHLLEKLIRDPSEVILKGKQAREDILARFTRSGVAKELKTTLESREASSLSELAPQT